MPRADRRAVIAGLVAVIGVLAVVLLAPLAFSDPNGVDPYGVRLAAASLAMVVAARRLDALRRALPILLAVAAFTVPYAIWQATPAILVAVAGPGVFTNAADFFISVAAQALATVGLCVLAVRVSGGARPDLRVRLRPLPVAWGLLGIALLVVVGLAIPAQWLGRLAIQPVAFGRLALWLIPGDLLQGALQELQFRGLLMGMLERVVAPWQANVAQAAIFSLGHLAIVYQGPEAPFVPLTFLLGVVLGYVTQKTRSLWPALMVHAAADVLVDLVVVAGLYGQ